MSLSETDLLENMPEAAQKLFTSYYDGAPAARLQNISEVIALELELAHLKKNYQTKQLHRKKHGRLVREFVVRLLG